MMSRSVAHPDAQHFRPALGALAVVQRHLEDNVPALAPHSVPQLEAGCPFRPQRLGVAVLLPESLADLIQLAEHKKPAHTSAMWSGTTALTAWSIWRFSANAITEMVFYSLNL